MQIGSLARLLKRNPVVWEGTLFTASVEGAGRDVVLIHGLAASPECWEEAGALLPGVRRHAIHMRGFAGLAPSALRDPMNYMKPTADALAAYIRTLKVGPVAVVGHSMGGLIALMLARDHADVVERLMVVDVPAYFSVLINPFATATSMAPFAQHSRRSYVERSKLDLHEDIRRTTEKLVRDSAHADRIIRWGVASDRQTTADVMAEVMVTDLRGDLQRIEAAVDVIYTWDRTTPASKLGLDQVYASSYAGLRNGRKVRIDDARHYVMFDQPAAFYGAVEAWLAR
jgi:pimeloyl-ACP methyl ester carboxylesterase